MKFLILNSKRNFYLIACVAMIFLIFGGYSFYKLTMEIAIFPTALDFTFKHHNPKAVFHIAEPKIIQGFYMTASTVSSKRFEELLRLAKGNQLNAVAVDLKDWEGKVAFPAKNSELRKFREKAVVIPNFEEKIRKIHRMGFYLIGRIAVFQDSQLAQKKPEWTVKNKSGELWKGFKGQTWLDPASQDVWRFNALLAREAYLRGFDEINFDYIRFPSDGNLQDIVYPVWQGGSKLETINSFFAYLKKTLGKERVKISASLFGLTCCRDNDMNIGQKLSFASRFFNSVYLMTYPSHYNSGFQDYKNKAEHPYEVVKFSLEEARKRAGPKAKLRTWVQDFDLGADYGIKEVEEQIRAVNETGGSGWVLWNARNVYSFE